MSDIDIIGIACDHGGKLLKQHVRDFLSKQGYQVRDYGVADSCSVAVDYPDYAKLLAEDISSGAIVRGIAICGTGIGMAIAANKFPNIRAALVWDEFTAKMAKEHNDANILCLGARVINHDRALDFVTIWLNTPFSQNARHRQRLEKILASEKSNR